MYLKGQKTPANRLWVDFCRLGVLVGLFTQYMQTVSLDNSVYVFPFCPCEYEMNYELYEGKALSIAPLQTLGELKSSLSAWKLQV